MINCKHIEIKPIILISQSKVCVSNFSKYCTVFINLVWQPLHYLPNVFQNVWTFYSYQTKKCQWKKIVLSHRGVCIIEYILIALLISMTVLFYDIKNLNFIYWYQEILWNWILDIEYSIYCYWKRSKKILILKTFFLKRYK